MKRLFTLFAVFAVAITAIATDVTRIGHSGAMNIRDRNATISREGVKAVERIAAKEPGLKVMIEQSIETTLKPGDLEIIQKVTLPKGSKYLNSGITKRHTPFQHPTEAKRDEVVYVLRSKTTRRTVQVKDNCLNPVIARIRAVPYKPKVVETTWNETEIDIDISVINNVSSTATATASTAPITIVFNNMTQAAPPMMMAQQSPFMIVRDSRGLLSLGYTVGGSTKIYNSNVSTNNNCNTNNNSNANSNSNANTTVVNTGSGSAAGSSGSSGNSNSSAGG